MLQPGFLGTTPPDWVRRRVGEGLGSVVLFARNIESVAQVRELVRGLRAENSDLIVAVDEEGGDVTRLEAHTGSSRPGNLALGVVDDLALTEGVAREIGTELAGAGITLDYAPDADVNSNPDNPVIGVRSFGADPELVARHTAAWVRGLQSTGVAACAKHFPGHGDTDVDSHLALPTVTGSIQDIVEQALPPFQSAIAAGVRAIMTGHLLVPALDPAVPATMSSRILLELLRGELGFDGLIITDGIEMRAVADRYGLAGAAVRAIAAGADAICLGGGDGSEEQMLLLRDALVEAVRRGELAEERLADAARRVRELAAWTRAAREETQPEQSGAVAAQVREQTARTRAARPEAQPGHPDAGTAQHSTQPAQPGTVAARHATQPQRSETAAARHDATPAQHTTPPPQSGTAATQHHTEPGQHATAPAQPGTAAAQHGWRAGVVAARRAVRVVDPEGVLPLGGVPHVVELAPETHEAIERSTPWGLAGVLGERRAGVTAVRLYPGDVEDGERLVKVGLAAAQGRPVVIVVRDVHRHGWMREAVETLLRVRPDGVVVELGVPGPRVLGAAYLATHGAARVCAEAAADVLLGGTE